MYSFAEIFPVVRLSLLRGLMTSHGPDVEKIRDSCFRERRVVNPLTRSRAISISVNAPLQHRNLGEDKAEQESWLRKYRDTLLQNLEEFPRLLDPASWKIMLFTHPESLSTLAPGLLEEFRRLDFVELHFMSSASEFLSPGTMWRFLPFGDHSLDELLILDIDESWEMNVNGWYADAADYNKPLTRAHHIPREGFWLNLLNPWTSNYGSINNYMPIMASKVLARPRLLGLDDISSLMAAYIVLRQQRVESGFPTTQVADGEPVTPYNRPYEGAPIGFGNHWNGYCFDERFLAHVIYHHAVERGEMCTYCFEQFIVPDLLAHLRRFNLVDFLSDFAYTQEKSRNNIIVNSGTIVDFPPVPIPGHPGKDNGGRHADLSIRKTGSVPLPTCKRGILPDARFHPSGQMLAVTSWAENEIYIYSTLTSPPSLKQRIRGSEAGFNSAHSTVFSPSGDKMIVNAYLDNTFLVFDVSPADCTVNPRPARIYRPPAELLTRYPHGMDLAADGEFLACVYCDGGHGYNKIIVYQLEAGEPDCAFRPTGMLDAKDIEFRNPKGVAFTPCGRGILVTLSDSNNLLLHDFDPASCRVDPKPRQILRDPESTLFHPEDVCFTRCGNYCLVANSSSNEIVIYGYDRQHRAFTNVEPAFRLGGPDVGFNYPHGLALSPDNRVLIVTDYGHYPEPDSEDSPLNEPAKVLMFEIGPGV